ncbi:MAG: hypothetical protein J6Y93_00210, partial [Treponema sp.]|nr:hypothetical protein [Treponema sp.]
MNYEQFTIKTQDALQNASALAQQKDNSEIGLEHILISLIEQQDGLVKPVIERIGASVSDLLYKLKEML